MREVEINGKSIGGNAPCYIIAEIGSNHNGDFVKALQSIEAKTIIMPCSHDLYFPPEDNDTILPVYCPITSYFEKSWLANKPYCPYITLFGSLIFFIFTLVIQSFLISLNPKKDCMLLYSTSSGQFEGFLTIIKYC